MNLSQLPKTVARSKKRLGRGHGSGRGKTAGRGTKGQKARGTIPADFEGGQLAITKRLPLMRGKGRNKSRKAPVTVVNLSALSVFEKGAKVTLDLLKKQGIVSKDASTVKVLGNGSIDVAVTVLVPCSQSAAAAIEKAGGSVSK